MDRLNWVVPCALAVGACATPLSNETPSEPESAGGLSAELAPIPSAPVEPIQKPGPSALPVPRGEGPASFELVVPGTGASLTFRRVTDPASGRPFWIGATEIPWEAYDSFVFGFDIPRDRRAAEWDAETRASRPYGSPDRGWGHDGFAALSMTAHAAEAFAAWLGPYAEVSLRLPTEREWELAASGGLELDASLDRTPFEGRVIPADLGQAVGWSSTEGPRPRALAELRFSPLGVSGMLGNVGEWIRTESGEALLAGGHFLDDPADSTATRRERQAPSWNATDPQNPKSRWWLSDAPFVGFRLVAETVPPGLIAPKRP